MRFLVVAVVIGCVACNRGPTKPHARGRLVFDVMPADKAGVFLATEAEVLRSAPVLDGVKQKWQTGDIDPSSISVARHPDTMILDVTVTAANPQVAAETCNRVMESYFDRRRMLAFMPLQEKMQVLSEKLEATPDDADLKRQLQDLDTQLKTQRSDVRVLEPCTVRR